MYWDNAKKLAVSGPFAEFFGNSLGIFKLFETQLFAKARSYNRFIPMPYKSSGRIEIVNQSSEILMFHYKVNFLKVPKQDDDMLYFHSHWRRELNTELEKDFEILPYVEGSSRYIGTHIGVIGNKLYEKIWFGEGEIKVNINGDDEFPTLVSTGTEDYIGSGWE
ncbi:DUF2961 domain-containing protein [Maribacter ulvicola]|uniref:Uncharacterized protein n=1 Tax=Maribacter ulvicola TaxID=228959 RepID=A0A1N6X7K0_9FLAO|nr:DUF2961 domain-containing protein [Maribacter ulvicola]SIQ98259.1 Protein of unknown function [Maribacter ulvicola]